MYAVAVLDHLAECSVEREILGDVAAVSLLAGQSSSARLQALRESDALLLWHIDRLTAQDIAQLERARIIQRVGVGFDNVDLAAARARRIPVCNVPDYGTEDVADHATALILALSRGLWAYGHAVLEDDNGWRWESGGTALARLRGQRLGLVGIGRIGTAVALRAKPFGLEVWAYDPYVATGYEKALGVRRVDALEELAECDILSIHAPLTDETRGMIGEEFWNKSDRPVLLVNTARGPIVEEASLCRAFRRGRVRGIGLDVLEKEPFSPRHPIAELLADRKGAARNIILTPHVAFYSAAAYRELRQKAALNVRRCLIDGSHRHVVS